MQREYNEGKVNSVSLLVLESDGSMSIDDARKEIQKPIQTCRRDLLRLVLTQDGVVPAQCKELLWKVCHFFYSRNDGFSSSVEKGSEVNAVINEPLQLDGTLRLSPPGGSKSALYCLYGWADPSLRFYIVLLLF
jgi:acyclic sesquiterpene synthase